MGQGVADGGTQVGLRLQLMGGFQATWGCETVELGPSSAELVCLLALRRRRATRSVLAGSLWPEKTESRATANLRTAIWRLPEHGRRILRSERGAICLDDAVTVDSEDIEAFSLALINCDSPGIPDGFGSIDLEAELLPGWDQWWVVTERERFRHLRLYALEALAGRLVDSEQPARAVLAALAAVQADPLRESAHRSLIRAHLADGNRSEAIRHYCYVRQLFADELGVEPSSSLNELMRPRDQGMTPT